MTSSRPWDADSPPRSFCVAEDLFARRHDGMWCRRGAVGRFYLVSANAERCANPRRVHDDEQRPNTISSYVWRVMIKIRDRLQGWRDHLDAALAVAGVHRNARRPLGVYSLIVESKESDPSV